MNKLIASGALFKAKDTNRYFFIQRSNKTSYSNRFGLVGGKCYDGENILDGLTREIIEEIGFMPKVISWSPFNKFISSDKHFAYTSVIIVTPKEFIPSLNSESSGYAWTTIDEPPKPLHPRLKEVFQNKVLIESLKNFN